MAVSIQRALDSALITVVKADKNRGIFKIKIGELNTVVTIKFFFDDITEMWRFEQSHVIKTPSQSGPYRPGIRRGLYRGALLLKAITGFTMFYRMAEREGFKPKQKWLMKWQ
jgi:hypothetical protein